jgi:septal ring factor EnvC (AmiA/AmiB activator)|mmetsp:Transcript_34172/g.54521  ORF Transcript_34172/g.54521 Transcript_34172/m.54521 type:complete len:718 (+) Transcript_34172:52-2205(+)|eukprot:CAMPEP_0169128814 /NCGR_PEP_ID=MMETSP1015-20121227/36784_1 /TAXON_ID=342587 /ORGANISM="Karlodinium micrum, Strain CCMP2283" /LENGTH=717 /DNA_ID=CAMNT_0009192773 /DNA_START=53 /DNA_END=2206 /DNA_ORIENTATION=-
MAAFRCALLLVLSSSIALSAEQSKRAAEKAELTVNPIRRVVTMLQSMQKKVTAEGEKEKELFEKFMCYCKNGKGALDGSIAAGQQKSEQLTASIKETAAALTQTKADLKTAQTDRSEAKAAVASATALREKEAAAYAKESSELKTNIDAMTKATTAIEKGMGGAFLQTSVASVLKQLSVTMDLGSMERDELTSFLTQGQGDAAGYVPQSGQIVGILKEMTDTMQKSLATATAEEEAAIKDFNGLMGAKTKEINALTKSVENKIAKIGSLGVQLATEKEDLDDTTKSLVEDAAFLKDLEKNCKTKEDEWEVRCKVRAEELLAIADTIKLLNDDDALELFKKTLPTPSLLQLKSTEQSVKARALSELQTEKGDFRLNLISLALKGKKVSFEKVLKMIDDMVLLLGDEQKSDDEKKEYCEKMIDKTEDDLKNLELTVSDLGKAIADLEETISTLSNEISALEDGITALDKQVAEATADRKEEHADNVETLASDNAAKELIGVAKNRLNKFYNPKLYVAPPKRELSEEDRITVNMGGTLAPTAAPGGIAGTGIEAMLAQSSSRVAPPPPPETFGAYSKKGEESTGVITMMDMMIADLDKEIQEISTEEDENQAEYEQFMKDSADKRATDAKSIADKESTKADSEASLLKAKEEKRATTKEAMATAQFLSEVHADCDWLLNNFQMRKDARAGEVDSLKKAKAVLAGADYSLLQSAHIHHHSF